VSPRDSNTLATDIHAYDSAALGRKYFRKYASSATTIKNVSPVGAFQEIQDRRL
jgi:hypothetical protein